MEKYNSKDKPEVLADKLIKGNYMQCILKQSLLGQKPPVVIEPPVTDEEMDSYYKARDVYNEALKIWNENPCEETEIALDEARDDYYKKGHFAWRRQIENHLKHKCPNCSS